MVLTDLGYRYGPDGQLTAIIDNLDPAQSEAISYDALNRLVQVAEGLPVSQGGVPIPVEDYAYDGEGNRVASHLSAVYSSNDHNQLLEDDTYTYAYDAKGNRISRTAKAGGAVESYTYDSQNRLVGYAGALTASYAHDALDRRIAKTVDGVVEAFIYDPWSATSTTANDAVLDFTNGTLTRRWLHGPQTDEPLAFETYTTSTTPGTGTARELHADRLGNILRVVDPATGTVAATYDYDSFGTRIPTGTLEQRYGFTGREHDAESGLIYFRARHYDAGTGTFMQRDPIGFAGGDLNLYAYVSNDPLNYKDPSGLVSVEFRVVTIASLYFGGREAVKFLAKRCLATPGCRTATLDKLANGIVQILDGLGANAPSGATAAPAGASSCPGICGIFEGILGLVDNIVRNMREITKAAANEGTSGGGGSPPPGDEEPEGDDPEIQFGNPNDKNQQYHIDRHFEESDISRSDVESAIRDSLSDAISNGELASQGDRLIGTVEVNGARFEFRAFNKGGIVNVGTIFQL